MKKTLLAFMAMMSLGSYAQQPVEGFEAPWVSQGPNLPDAPPGWIVINYMGPVINWKQTIPGNTQQPPFGGSGHSAYLDKENVSPTDAIPTDWLISPVVTPQINSQISFRSRLTIDDNQGSIYKIYVIPATVVIDPNAFNFQAFESYLVSTYTELEMNPVQTEWTEKLIPMPQNLAGVPVRVGLVMQGDNGDRWFIDDFTVTNACYAPTALHVTDITSTDATLGWTDNNGATAWEIEVIQADGTPTGIGIPAPVNPFVVTGLTSGAYKFYVRAVCGPEQMSPWTGPFYFSTDIAYNNVLQGVVKYDANGDGLCNDEGAVLANSQVTVSVNGVAAYTVYTNQQGEYTLYGIPDGTTVLSFQVTTPMTFPEVPVLEEEVIFDEEINELSLSHCFGEPLPQNNMVTYMSPVWGAVPGFNAKYSVGVGNIGNVINNNVNVTLTFDTNRLDYVSSILPATVSGNTITIDFGSFDTGAWKSSEIVFLVKVPPTNMGGDVLNFTTALSEIPNDIYPGNNNTVLNQTIVNSFDPNDITVHEGAKISEEQADEYLTYTIRFQNTGNGNAINVKLENTLDDLLDWDTFEPIKSSHSNAIKREGNQLEFFFAGINLPYESADEPGSHGFVTYRVKPKAEYGLGDIVSNKAEIYFDFNEAVMTNTATTEVIALAGLNENALVIAKLYPNPAKDQLHVEVALGELQSVAMYDVNGRLCLLTTAEIIDINKLTAGIYFVKVTTDAGSANYKIIKH